MLATIGHWTLLLIVWGMMLGTGALTTYVVCVVVRHWIGRAVRRYRIYRLRTSMAEYQRRAALEKVNARTPRTR